MKLDELLRFAGLFFEREGVDYFVFGAAAMNFWVPPRNTVDLDVVVSLDKRKAAAVVRKLRKEKIPLSKHLAGKLLEGRLIKVPLGDTELDLKLCKTRHEREALTRAKTFEAKDHRLRIAVPEDLILFKLQYWRKQDQADIESILKQRKDLDLKRVESWLGAVEEETDHPVRERWREARTWIS